MRKIKLIDKSLVVSPNVSSKKIKKTWYLLVSNAEEYISLNESASTLWELLLEMSSVKEIVFHFAEHYGVKEDQVKDDVLELLEELVAEKIVIAQ